MNFFIKKLTRNELGLTGANTLGEIYVPRVCLDFFPPLSDSPRPECSLTVTHRTAQAFRQFEAFVTVYDKGEAHLRRMKPVLGPHVQPGDYLALCKLPNEFFEASIIRQDSMIAALLETHLGKEVAAVLTESDVASVTSSSGETFESLMEAGRRLPASSDEQLTNDSIDLHKVIDHPLTSGMPPEWASEWGQDEFGPWCSFDVDGIQQRLRWIPAGKFQMGVADEYKGLFDEDGPQHWVTLTRGFWMFETKCSWKLFNAVMDESILPVEADDISAGNLPYWNARRFCGQLGEILGGVTVKMPTDAQWEFACRAGRQDSDIERNSPDAESPSNPWGLRDILSGVGELCWDGAREYSEEPVTDPIGNGESVSVRGLPRVVPNWAFRARAFRARAIETAMPHGRQTHPSFREIVAVDIAVKDAGFRCVIPQDDWIPVTSIQSLPTVEESDAVSTVQGGLDEPSVIPQVDTPLAGLIRDMESHLHRYYSDLIELPPDVETRWRLVNGNPLCEAGRRVVHAIPNSVPDSKGTPNFPDRGGRLWYMLLRTSRRAKFRDARPFLIAAAKDLAVWLNDHYPNELPHTFVVGDIPLPLRIDNLRTILTVRDLSAGLKVGTGTGWPADQHPLLHAAVEVLVAIPDAITAADGTPNFPGVGSALWPQLKNLVMTTDDSQQWARQRSAMAEQFREWLANRYRTESLEAAGIQASPAVETTVPSSSSTNESTAQTFDVFLSFNLADREAIEPIVTEIRLRGLTVFLDTEHLTLGEKLSSAIRQALRNARCVVVCVSTSSIGDWQRFEIESYMRSLPEDEGHQFFENIIPVLLPGAPEPADAEKVWNTKRWLDFRRGLGAPGLEQLLAVIQERI